MEELVVIEIQEPEEYEKVSDDYQKRIVDEYEKVLDEYPESEYVDDALLSIGDFYNDFAEDYQRALTVYDSLYHTFPDSALADDALFNAGKIKGFKLSDSHKLDAINDMEKLLSEYPESDLKDDATYQIAEIYYSIKELDAALEWYEKVVNEFPESELVDEVQMKIAEIYEAKEEYEKAAEEYEKVESSEDKELAEKAAQKKKELGEKKLSEDVDDVEKGYYGGGTPYDFARYLEKEEILLNDRVAAENLDVLHYDLILDIDPEHRELSSNCKLRLKNNGEAKSAITLKLNDVMEIKSATINGESCDHKLIKNAITLSGEKQIKKEEAIDIELVYHGVENGSPAWAGDKIDPKGSYLRFESKWYPQSHWGDLFTSNIEVSVPEKYTAIATGNLMDETANDEKKSFVWKMDKPVFTMSLAAADYKMEKSRYKNIEIRCYLFPEDFSRANYYTNLARDILKFYSNRFCEYPFDSFSIAEIPFFPGGYGSPTLVMLADFSVRDREESFPLLAHEMAHQWWGNLVSITMTGSSIPWLNEGFATYSDALYTESKKGRKNAVDHLEEISDVYLESVNYAPDEPIASCSWSSPVYQPIVYYKGAKVLDMLRYVVGDEAFFNILKQYATNHQFQNVTLEDFIRTCNENYHESLDWFFDQWIYRSGAMEAEIDTVFVEKVDKQFSVKTVIKQHELFEMPVEIKLKGEDTIERRIFVDQDIFEWETTLTSAPAMIILDEDKWILWKDNLRNIKILHKN